MFYRETGENGQEIVLLIEDQSLSKMGALHGAPRPRAHLVSRWW